MRWDLAGSNPVMLIRVAANLAELKANPPPVPVGDIAEAIHFLEWLSAGHFTLLGVQEYTVAADHDLGGGRLAPLLHVVGTRASDLDRRELLRRQARGGRRRPAGEAKTC